METILLNICSTQFYNKLALFIYGQYVNYTWNQLSAVPVPPHSADRREESTLLFQFDQNESSRPRLKRFMVQGCINTIYWMYINTIFDFQTVKSANNTTGKVSYGNSPSRPN